MNTVTVKTTLNQITCFIRLSMDNLIELTSLRHSIELRYPDVPGGSVIEPLILHHDDYESFEDALAADFNLISIESDTWARTGLDESHKRGFAAHVIGLSTIEKICNGTYERLSKLLYETDVEQHITVAITIDSFNYITFGVRSLDSSATSEFKPKFSPECPKLKPVIAEALGAEHGNYQIHEPFNLPLDFNLENDGIYCVVCDYVTDPETAGIAKNVVVAKLLH